jgi:hypothetical protein
MKNSIDEVTNSITLQDMADDYNNMSMLKKRSENNG